MEISSSVNSSDVYQFERKVKFYIEKEKTLIDRKIIISPYVIEKALNIAKKINIEIYSSTNELNKI